MIYCLNGLSRPRQKTFLLAVQYYRKKALHFSKELGFRDFRASNGWLDSWKNKFSIAHFKVCGESDGVNMDTVNDFQSRIDTIVRDYKPQHIINCDERGLFLELFPIKP